MRYFLPLLFCLLALAHAQGDYAWWNAKHGWDGTTPWHHYIRTTPAYMGPNALPVPDVNTGLPDSAVSLTTWGQYHHSPGDQTTNLRLDLEWPLLPGRIALHTRYLAHEWWRTDTTTRDLRAARTQAATGQGPGDVYFTFKIAVLPEKPRRPSAALHIGLKTASGGSLEDARHIDAPAYWLDMGIGRTLAIGSTQLRPYGAAGFYVWQTTFIDQFQDDAYMYALGLRLQRPRWHTAAEWAGYSGYLGRGDRPQVLRLHALLGAKNLRLALQYQQGLRDYAFTSLSVGLQWRLPSSWPLSYRL